MGSGVRRSRPDEDEAAQKAILLGDRLTAPAPALLPAAPTAPASGFEIGEVIAESGMGVVRNAVQRSLSRSVVVKTAPTHGTSDDAKRMLLEAWVTGYLEHPGIVPIYDIVAEEGGTPIVVMRHIRGKTWSSVLRDEAWAKAQGARDLLEQNLRVLVRVCEIVEFAHSKHILHRDLKPANVMVGAFGEVYLLDWGLAVATGGEPANHLPRAELAKDVCGTLSYAAPEMISVIAEPISERTDIYLLGSVLFEIATGRPPHRARETRETVESIDTTPPRMPDAMSPHLAGICSRALQKDPQGRHGSVAELRSDILAFLRQRDSEHVLREAERTLGRLRDACAKNEARQLLYDLYGECRFAFREALRTWPESARAREGLVVAVRSMVEHELAAGEPRVAATLLADCPERIPEVADRVEQALAREEEDRRRLAKVARDHDASIGRRGRRVFLILMGLAWSAGQFGDRFAPITYRRFIIGSLIQLPIVAVAWTVSPELRSTLFNRRIAGAVAVMLSAQALLFVSGFVLGVDIATTRLAQVGLWALVATLLTIVLERKFWPMATALVGAAVTVTLAPESRPYASTIAILVATVNLAMFKPADAPKAPNG